ncbi:MAG: proton-conducting membrane transporter [bacterium]|nr:proton-conducting membrane transporter [bacterium]
MNEIVMMAVVLIPMFGGILVPLLSFRSRRVMLIYMETAVILTSVLVFCLLLYRPEGTLTLFRFTGNLSITLRLDGPGGVYAGLVAALWPFAMLYSFEYMEKERNEKTFFLFYMVAYGVTLGVALSENILTMYFFFEMLSLVTLPLVMHTRTRQAILASRTYLYYMLGGAAFAFAGMAFVLTYGSTSSFLPGGVLDPALIGDKTNMPLVIFVLCFCGFAVKTAVWPFSAWLPKAGAAPAPVTALLHAVAVVNTGAFAVMRVTYYSFGVETVRGTWAQRVVMGLTVITIVYGCSRALKETHLKRRLAWSTVSNLSYVLFGLTMMTPLGFVGGMAHMIFHSVMKICSFFCAGAVIHQTGRNYVHELDGLGFRMPKVFAAFTVSALALTGVPGLCGFVGKWRLAEAAADSGSRLAYAGVAALMISALLTAVYMLSIVVRAWFPGKDFDYSALQDVKDPGWQMWLPLAVSAIAMFGFGLHSGPVIGLLEEAALAAFGR